MNRRDALQVLAALPWLSAALSAKAGPAPPVRTNMGLVIHSFVVRGSRPLPPDYSAVGEPLALIEAAAKFGAVGVQVRLGLRDNDYLSRLRETLDRHNMYLEGMVALPKDEADRARFDEELRNSKAAGITVLRTVCMSGRRYETLDAAEQFRQFTDQSWRSLTLAEPIAKKHDLRLAVENHKDWRIDEMLVWLKRLDSEHVGVCLDTGNSIALLEEPHQVVEAYAPWTFTTHIKDMGVAEYEDGFLLAEVPLGQGHLDLPRMVQTLRKARPEVRLNLEMMTRDPLRVPCLTSKYWATLSHVPGSELAEALARVRRSKSARPLPVVSQLDHRAQLEIEGANIVASLDFAREKLTK